MELDLGADWKDSELEHRRSRLI